VEKEENDIQRKKIKKAKAKAKEKENIIKYYCWTGIVEKIPSSGHGISFETKEKQLSTTSLYCIVDIFCGVGYTIIFLCSVPII